MSWTFIVAACIVIATPGTGAFYCLATALDRGLRAGLVAAFGCAVATAPHATLAITGLASVLAANPTLYRVISYLGAAFLVWMAWGMWTDASTLDGSDPTAAPRRGLAVVAEAITINLLNPKLTLFFVAFLPQFVPRSVAAPTQLLIVLSSVFMVLTFVIYVVYVALADRLRVVIVSRPKLLVAVRRACAVMFVALGGYVVLSSV